MKQQIEAQLLSVYIGEDDKWRGGLLYPAVVKRLQEAGIAGVTVLHGVEGFGVHHKLHTTRFEVLFDSMPVVIEAIDTKANIAGVIPILDEMIEEGLVTLSDVAAIKYTKA